MFPVVRILNVPIHAVTNAQALAWIASAVAARTPHQVCTANPEFVMAAQRDAAFMAILNQADLVIPDGVGLLWAARWLGQRLPERVAGSDLVERIPALAAQHGWRLYFLGAAEGVAQRAADILQARYPGWVLAGAYSGSPHPEADEAQVAQICAAQPDVLFVAYGAPQQDKWIRRNLHRVRVPVCMGVGGSFDFIAGIVPRAPPWAQRLSLEWAYRLWRQPWRAKRIFTAVVGFPLAVVFKQLSKKTSRMN